MKAVLSTIVVFLSMSPLFAQLKIGMKAGGTLTNFATEGIGLSSGNYAEANFSYVAGATTKFPLNDRLSLQTDLLYGRKGAQTGFVTALNETSRTSDHLHYISITPLLHYQITSKLYVGAGPEISYLIGSYERSQLLGSRSTLIDYQPFDLAVNFDVQYHLLKKWSVGLRYNLGIYDITERFERTFSDDEVFVIDSDVYNRSIQLSIYYWLR